MLRPTRHQDGIVRGVLSVTVVAAEELPVMDVMGKADQYVVINIKNRNNEQNKGNILHPLCSLSSYSSSLNI